VVPEFVDERTVKEPETHPARIVPMHSESSFCRLNLGVRTFHEPSVKLRDGLQLQNLWKREQANGLSGTAVTGKRYPYLSRSRTELNPLQAMPKLQWKSSEHSAESSPRQRVNVADPRRSLDNARKHQLAGAIDFRVSGGDAPLWVSMTRPRHYVGVERQNSPTRAAQRFRIDN
jgi:hypothetical protein